MSSWIINPYSLAVAGSWQSTFSETLNGDSNSWAGYTVRQPIPNARWSVSGTKIRVTIRAGSSEACTFSKLYVGKGTGIDFDEAPTAITFNTGSASVVVSAGANKLSDEITFTSNEAEDYLFSAYFNGGGSSDMFRVKTSETVNHSYKLGDDTTTLTASGYASVALTLAFIELIEVFG